VGRVALKKVGAGTSGGEEPLTSLQERFLRSGLKDLKVAEIVELLLLCPELSPQEGRKLAKQVMERFKTLRGLVGADPEELRQAGITPDGILHIRFVREIAKEVLKEKIKERPTYTSPQDIFDYLSYSMRDLNKEVFKVIYLNKAHQIIDTHDLFEGTLDGIPISPREIVESTIKSNAAALIFAHNHPSGDPAPSRSDKQLTRDLVFMGNIVQIKVLDHIIVGENTYFSFAEEGLIEKYENAFLNLKIRSTLDLTPYVKRREKVPAYSVY